MIREPLKNYCVRLCRVKPEMQARLKGALDQAFEEDWQALLSNRQAGVLAGVDYLAGEIEANRLKAVMRPLRIELPAQDTQVPGDQRLQYRAIDAAPADDLELYKAQ